MHPSLVKRALVRDKPSGRKYLNYLTREEMVVATAEGGGMRTPDAQRKYDVKILDVYGETASVRTDSPDWIDYLHLVKQDRRWVIANVLYAAKRGSDRTE